MPPFVRPFDQALHARLRTLGLPAFDRRLLERRLTRRDDDLPLVDVRLQHRHRTLVEKVRVVVARIAREDFHRVRAAARREAELRLDVLAHERADGFVVIGRKVRDSVRIQDEAVVRDDGDAFLLGLGEHVRQLPAIDGADDKAGGVLRNQRLNLLNLLVCCVSIRDRRRESFLFEHIFDRLPVFLPARRRIRECHRHAFPRALRTPTTRNEEHRKRSEYEREDCPNFHLSHLACLPCFHLTDDIIPFRLSYSIIDYVFNQSSICFKHVPFASDGCILAAGRHFGMKNETVAVTFLRLPLWGSWRPTGRLRG